MSKSPLDPIAEELRSIREALHDQAETLRSASEAANQTWKELAVRELSALERERNETRIDRESEPVQQVSIAWATWFGAWATLLGVVAASFSVYFIWSQLQHATQVDRYATQVEKSARMPAIFPGPSSLRRTTSTDGRPGLEMTIPFINSGETEAVRPFLKWGYGYQPPGGGNPAKQWRVVSTWKESIWPKGSPNEDRLFIPYDQLGVGRGGWLKHPIYFYGTIQYLDIFPPVDTRADCPKEDPSLCRNDHRVQWLVMVDNLDREHMTFVGHPMEQGSCFDRWCGAYKNHPYDPDDPDSSEP